MVHESVIIAFKTLTLALGATITYYTYRAYKRTESRPLALLSLGFAVVTIGTLSAGAANEAFGLGIRNVLVIESVTTTLGFAIILYSLYAQ